MNSVIFRTVYYVGGIISAILGNPTKLNYYEWVGSVEHVRNDVFKILVLLVFIGLCYITSFVIAILSFLILAFINLLFAFIKYYKKKK